MMVWPLEMESLSRTDIMRCVQHKGWQKLRLEMKGETTRYKLNRLMQFLQALKGVDEYGYMTLRDRRTVVINYINALLRGGQLKRTEDGKIVVNR